MNEVNVLIGQIRVGQGQQTLRALLGSCVGVALIWRERGACGLAHCLLPEAPAKSFLIEGRYVDRAVPSLLSLLKAPPEKWRELEAAVVGGGDMTGSRVRGRFGGVGERNAAVALNELAKRGIRIATVDVRGDGARQIWVDCASLEFRVERVADAEGA